MVMAPERPDTTHEVGVDRRWRWVAIGLAVLLVVSGLVLLVLLVGSDDTAAGPGPADNRKGD